LLGAARAIVTDIPGTTRDLLTETIDIDGLSITLVDTAGIRTTVDTVESEGVNRARGALGVAAAIILVLDQSRPLEDEDHELLGETQTRDRVIVINKADLTAQWVASELADCGRRVMVSLLENTGLTELRQALADTLCAKEPLRDTPTLSNLRHIGLVQRASAALSRAAAAATASIPEELVLADLQEARGAFEEVTGKRTSDDVLEKIFTQFCIGK
jgi:tRNA modification GTPase